MTISSVWLHGFLMEDGGWYFPPSYDEWNKYKDAHGSNILGIEVGMENAKIASGQRLSQQLDSSVPNVPVAEEKPACQKKKKKKTFRRLGFHEKYDLMAEVLGRGAHSLVALAVEKNTAKEFAVKVIDKYDGYDRSRVLREIDLLHFLADCPNVLHLYDCSEETNEFYLVFERMEGGPLLSHIQHKKFFTEKEASLVVKDIAHALKFLHDKGIAHRDMKPDNILCVYKEKIVPVVLCDFNLASGLSMIGGGTTPDLYTPVGSAEYMAPEVVDAFVGDAPAYDKKCDLWSLGVILYIMLSGKPPFTGNCGQNCDWERGGACRQCQSILWHNILDANYCFPDDDWANVSVEAKDLISHLLVKDASKRYTADSVLTHPWLEIASYNRLSTPDVLTREHRNHRLSTLTSETMAYSRIISERQNSAAYNRDTIAERWSTPPSFGLSPPGKSSLAKRRSLKIKANLLESPITEVLTPENESTLVGFGALLAASTTFASRSFANTTPVQSPCSDTPRSGFRLPLEQLHLASKGGSSPCMFSHAVDDGGLFSDHTPTDSTSSTPVSTPRDNARVSLKHEVDERTAVSRKKLQLQLS